MQREIRRRQQVAALNFVVHVATLMAVVILGCLACMLFQHNKTGAGQLLAGLGTMLSLILGAVVVTNMGIEQLPRHSSSIERLQHWLHRAL